VDRREFIARSSQGSLLAAVTLQWLHAGGAEISRYSPLPPGPAVELFKQAQSKVLSLYAVSAESRFVIPKSSSLPAHVLETGHGPPVVLIHGGGECAVFWAPLLAPLQTKFHALALDMPGCGLTYRIDYRGMPFRKAAEGFVGEMMDALHLKEAILIGHSLGGYFALAFALTYPDRVTKLVLLGEPAGSQPRSRWLKITTDPSMRAAPHTTMQETREDWSHFSVVHMDRVKQELLEADNAASNLEGYAASWNSSLDEEIAEQHLELTYGLKAELPGLRPSTLLVWGDKDYFGPPSEGQEMAKIAPHARCEVLEDSGHAVWIDQPDRCAELVSSFLLS